MAQTVMYSVVDKKDRKTGTVTKEVIRHVLPWGKNAGHSPVMAELHSKAIARYLSKGYTLQPPTVEVPPDIPEGAIDLAPPTPDNNLICPVCGREAKSQFGLNSHMRTHNK